MAARSNSPELLSAARPYGTLSLRDLVVARDHYHVHLMTKANVVGTALGYYLIRTGDPWPGHVDELARWQHDEAKLRAAGKLSKAPRTLANSHVRPYSWPCVLVFVSDWVRADERRAREMSEEDVIPRALHMPDGTRVPVCVVHAPLDEHPPASFGPQPVPGTRLGGGYPVRLEVQNRSHFASLGCLVTDGHTVYALTNRHVAGEAGSEVLAVVGDGAPRRIGTSSAKRLTRSRFCDVYEGWECENVWLNRDVGLVRVDDLNDWTAQVYGIGALGRVADLSAANLSLRLVNARVRAFGAASGPLAGTILGLFHRYKSLGGFDYVADFLIGPHEGKRLETRPGDSGTLWVLEDEKDDGPRPIALQWGGQRFAAGEGSFAPYALATCLSTVLQELDVDVVRDWNIGLPEYWGATGHYTIASRAVDLVTTPGLVQLMRANLERISFPLTDQLVADIQKMKPEKMTFCPLADVPDLVWQARVKGLKLGRGDEGGNHFADMDAPDSSGQTLLARCRKSPAKGLDPAVWIAYFADAEVKKLIKGPGSLPFRVWQIYQEMVRFAHDGLHAEFVCAAGILSHYVGDACQPLHVSFFHHGDPRDTVMKGGEKKNRADDVHSVYEADMIDRHLKDVREKLLAAKVQKPAKVAGGKAAAVATFKLMDKTFKATPPASIVRCFMDAGGDKKASDAIEPLWQAFHQPTIQNMANGAATLAMLWESAWIEGQGQAPAAPVAFTTKKLHGIYIKSGFLESHSLKELGAILK